MIRAAWKSLLSRKARLLLSALSIVLGVAFVAGSFIFTDMLGNAFNGITKGTVADVNVDPIGTYTSNSNFTDTGTSTAGRVTLTPADIARFGAVSGVEKSTGAIMGTGVYPVGSTNKAIATGGAPAIATNWFTDPAAGHQPGVVLKSGREPRADTEMVVDPSTLTKSGLALGDQMTIVLPDGTTAKRTLVGTATWGGGGSVGATYIFLTTHDAQALLLQGRDLYTGGWITVSRGANVDTVTQAVQAVVPANYEAVSGQTAADNTTSQINRGLSFINTFLLVFAAIALLVATFLIVNTFSIIVAQRGRELALFRAIGASRRQMTRTVLFEAAVTGFIGATLGLLLGWLLALGIRSAFIRLGWSLGDVTPRLTWKAVLASYAIGLIITMVASWLPARRAGRVPPVAAMGGEIMTGASELGRRAVAGATLTILGVVGVVVGLWTHVAHRPVWVGVGVALVLIGVASASPLMGRPLILLLGWVYRRVFSQVGRLAELNSVRQPRRTAATASALMLSLALVTTLAVLGSSASKSIHSIVTTSSRTDFVISSVVRGGLVPAPVIDAAKATAGVEAVYPMYDTYITVDGQPLYLDVVDPSGFGKVIDQTLVAGTQDTELNSVLVEQKTAAAKNLTVGSTITGTTIGTRKPVTLTVSGIYTFATEAGTGGYRVNVATGRELGASTSPYAVGIDKAATADAGVVRQGLESATASLPTVIVQDNEDIANQATSQVDQMLRILYALLGLAVVIAVLGIVNTLALSVIERTREIGLLRAVGLTRRQLRTMVTLESVIIALLGSVLGLTLGIAFGTVLQQSLKNSGLNRLALPWTQILVFVVAAVLVGMVAAIWPARRAARVDILRAIATE